VTFKQIFLPAGIVFSILVSLAWPEPGSCLKDLGLMTALVVSIFIINGYSVRLSELEFNRRFVLVLVLVLLLNLAVAPTLAVLFARLLHLPPELATGLAVMSSVPCTLSSAVVLTQVAGGNVLLALLLTVGLNLGGIVSIPFALQAALRVGGAGAVSPLQLLAKLALLVLLPLACGKLLNFLLRNRTPPFDLNYLATACVIGAVWLSLSKSSGVLLAFSASSFFLVLAGALLVHLSLLGLAAGVGQALKLPRGDRIAILFTASQKTLLVALSVFAALELSAGAGIMVCLIFHFQQLLLNSIIAARLAR